MRLTLFAALLLTTNLPAFAQDALPETSIVLDYRDDTWRALQTVTTSSFTADVIEALMPMELAAHIVFGLSRSDFAAVAQDITIISEVRGSFTASGERQRALLLGIGKPLSIDPQPQYHQALAIMEDRTVLRLMQLVQGSSYQRAPGLLDINGDGIHEVWLESSFYNMGQQVDALDLVQLRGNGAQVVERFPEVYVDSCENPVGAQERSATTISFDASTMILSNKRYELACTVPPEAAGAKLEPLTYLSNPSVADAVQLSFEDFVAGWHADLVWASLSQPLGYPDLRGVLQRHLFSNGTADFAAIKRAFADFLPADHAENDYPSVSAGVIVAALQLANGPAGNVDAAYAQARELYRGSLITDDALLDYGSDALQGTAEAMALFAGMLLLLDARELNAFDREVLQNVATLLGQAMSDDFDRLIITPQGLSYR